MNIEPTNSNAGCLTFPFRILGDLIKSFTNPKTQRSTIILISSIFGSCVICLTGVSIMNGIGISNTPTPTFDLISMQQTAQSSALLSFTQTALALPNSANSPNACASSANPSPTSPTPSQISAPKRAKPSPPNSNSSNWTKPNSSPTSNR